MLAFSVHGRRGFLKFFNLINVCNFVCFICILHYIYNRNNRLYVLFMERLGDNTPGLFNLGQFKRSICFTQFEFSQALEPLIAVFGPGSDIIKVASKFLPCG